MRDSKVIRTPSGVLREAMEASPGDLESALGLLRKVTEALGAREDDLEQFVYRVSHDLKAPLRAIESYAGFLSRDYGHLLPAEAGLYFERIQFNARLLSDQMNGLLELSRIGRFCAAFETFPLEEAALECTESLRGVSCARGVDLRIGYGRGPLPVVTGERRRIVQLLRCLVENGVKFRRPSQGGYVEVAACGRDGMAGAAVEDDGIGIPEQDRHRVFGLFERLNRLDEYPGLGLGLTVAKKIVEFHGGAIWIETGEDGKGSRVCFVLPPVAPPGGRSDRR